MSFGKMDALLVFIIIVIVALIVVPIVVLALGKPHEIAATPANLGSWTSLGAVSTGHSSAYVYKRTDPDTGATVYISIGSSHGGIYVLPAEKPK